MVDFITTAIDSVQYAKTQFLNTFVKEEMIREPLQRFVNAQAQFARQTVQATNEFVDAASKFDIAGSMQKAFAKPTV